MKTKDVLSLKFPVSASLSIKPSPALALHEKELLQIKDLRKRLQYYNKHICSLSFYFYHPDGLQSFGKYNRESGYGKIFFQVGSKPENDPAFEIYLQERQKEISRLKKLVNKENSYADKLECFRG